MLFILYAVRQIIVNVNHYARLFEGILCCLCFVFGFRSPQQLLSAWIFMQLLSVQGGPEKVRHLPNYH